MKLLLPLAHYHITYLIIKLIRIDRIFYSLKIVLFLLDLSLTPSHLLHKSLTSFSLTKY
jgi:hypothetical protein